MFWHVGFWGTFSTWLQQAMYVVLVVGYMEKFIHMDSLTAYAVKIFIILLFTIINLLGLREVSGVNTVISILVILAFGAVAIVGFANWNYNPIEPFINEEEGLIGSLGGSVSIGIWMFCGYECMSNMAEECENPQVIPRGLLIAMPIIALSYFLPTLAGLASVGNWESWVVEGKDAVGYADVLIQNVGVGAGFIFMIVAVLSNCAIFNAYITSGSRGFFVMADDHLFPRFLVKVSKNRGVPHVSIITMAIFTIVLCQWDFTTLVMATTPLQLYLYMALAISIRRLRKKYPVEERAKKGIYYIPGGKAVFNYMTVLPFIITVIALYVNGMEYFISGFIILFISLVGYIICKRAYGGLSRINEKAHPLNPKTGLAMGDTIQISIYLFLCGIASLLGSILLYLYEGEWGEAYYLETYGSGFFSDFFGMLFFCRIAGLFLIVAGFALYRLGKRIE